MVSQRPVKASIMEVRVLPPEPSLGGRASCAGLQNPSTPVRIRPERPVVVVQRLGRGLAKSTMRVRFPPTTPPGSLPGSRAPCGPGDVDYLARGVDLVWMTWANWPLFRGPALLRRREMILR